MALVTTVGASDSDSYIELTDANTYLEARNPFTAQTEYADWLALSNEAMEYRLRLAASVLDGLTFRGAKASRAQARAFPRLYTGDDLYPRKGSSYLERRLIPSLNRSGPESEFLTEKYETWADLVEYADAISVAYPTVPDAVKQAQVEVAFQVIHCHLLSLEANEEGSTGVIGLKVGPLSVNFAKSIAPAAAYSVFRSVGVDAQSMILFLLKPYLTRIRGALI